MRELRSGMIIDDKYEIVGQLGSGGFGSVYEARQLSFDRTVALKLLEAIDEESFQRFEREARVLSTLKHRNLAVFYGFGIWETSPYMAMELIVGESLESILDLKGRMEPREAAEVIKQVAGALSCAHANGIIHRDLKPGNILVDENDLVKLIDFGLASIPDDQQKLTREGFTVGTYMYMSPEQCQGLPVDARSDIYSLGCVLHKCLTGSGPYLGNSPAEMLERHLCSEPIALSRSLPEGTYPPELQLILNKALAKDPEERYQAVDAMAFDLSRVFHAKPELLASNAPPPVSLSTPIMAFKSEKRRNNPSLLKAGALAGFILLAGATVFSLFQNHPDSTHTLSVDYLSQARMVHDRDNGDSDEAKRQRRTLFQKALVANATDHLLADKEISDIYNHMTLVSVSLNDHKEAARSALEGIAYLRQKRQYTTVLAELCAWYCGSADLLKESGKAIKLLNEILDESPQNDSQFRQLMYLHLATAYTKVGDMAAARAAFARVQPSVYNADEDLRHQASKLREAFRKWPPGTPASPPAEH